MKDSALLDAIAKQPHGRTSLRHLFKVLRISGAEREVTERAIARLVGRGELIELPDHSYAIATSSRDFIAGRVSIHRDGYGFLVPDHAIPGMSGDLYIPRDQTKGAMNGDRAVAKVTNFGAAGRVEGAIVRILKRAHATVVGEFRITRRGLFVVPEDGRLNDWIEIPEDLALPSEPESARDRIGAAPVKVSSIDELDGMIVNAEIVEYGEGQRDNPVGRIVEILGSPEDFGIDVEVMIRKHHIPHHFPEDVMAEAKSVPTAITARELEGRRDFRHLPIVTIDGETARDFDDAVYVEQLANGNFALQVHIADVSHYVRPGSAIDGEARLRGTSVYFPDRAVPMLPYELSTDICSLVPHLDRLVMSALLEIDPRGEPVSAEFCRGVIRSAERMTYTNVFLLLEGDAALRERYAPLVGRFLLMRDLAGILERRRDRRGSIDFDLPEPVISFDENGFMTGIGRSQRNIANRLIEEFMLAANEAVATRLEQSGAPSIYRIHELPDPKRVMEFEEVAAQFGYSLGVGAIPVDRHRYHEKRSDGRRVYREVVTPKEIKLSSKAYQHLVAKVAGKPEERILSYLMLRSLRQARYSEKNSGHFALAASHYTHFTSPIRRYPDLIVHRLLKAVLDERPGIEEAELREISDECSLTERRAADAERELVEWKKAKFMETRIGQEFDALAISATRHGLFVELTDLFVEGLIPIDSLPGDRYTFRENVRMIVGERTRREFSIGDRLRVVLERIDPLERKLQFGLVEPAACGSGKTKKRKVR